MRSWFCPVELTSVQSFLPPRSCGGTREWILNQPWVIERGWGETIKEREREIGGSQLHFLSDRNPTLRDSLLSAVFTERA